MNLQRLKDYSTIFLLDFNLKNKELSPLENIKDVYSKEYNVGNISSRELVHIYKLIGNATFRSRIETYDDIGMDLFGDYNKPLRDLSEQRAKVESMQMCATVDVCPVCGCKSMVVIDDEIIEDDENGDVLQVYPYKIGKCSQCGLELTCEQVKIIPRLSVLLPSMTLSERFILS